MSSTTTRVTEVVPFAVSSPFDSDSDADIVLRSCDKYEFQARKAILSFGSSIFDGMFTLPQPKEKEHEISTDDGSQLPSIELSEEGLVIDALLRYCYPLRNPPIEKFDLSVLVLRAAQKYDMADAVSEIIAALHDQRLTHPDSLLFLYRWACDHHNGPEARGYAWDCLTLSCSSIVRHGQGLSLDDALPNLIDYHHAVSKGIGEHIASFNHISKLACNMWRSCSTCNIDYSREPKWWRHNLASLLQEICANGPRSKQIRLRKQHISQLCQHCSNSVFQHWDTFEEELITDLDREAREFVFILPWKVMDPFSLRCHWEAYRQLKCV